MTDLVPLIETLRGDTSECLHFGALAVCDAQGRVIASAGDPHRLVYTRSTLKPFQALPLVASGGVHRLGLDARQLAIVCSSHSGEAMHVEQVEAVLAACRTDWRRLQCGCHVPAYVALGVGPTPAVVDERHHNCSGKHAGFLAWCALHGASQDDYLDPGHPLQSAVRGAVARAAGVEPGALRAGTDGCSAPNYAMPLSRLAHAYARLASGAADAQFGASFESIAGAMVAHPQLVSGTGRFDLACARAGAGDWICKGGADGVQAIASRSRAQAMALKISDGQPIAVQAATVAVLDQLGWLDERQREALRPWCAERMENARGLAVGRRRAAFRLRGSAG